MTKRIGSLGWLALAVAAVLGPGLLIPIHPEAAASQDMLRPGTAPAPRFPTVAFVGDGYGWVGGDGGILATTDGGQTWRWHDTVPGTVTAIQLLDRRTGWAVANGALLGTADGGETWAALGAPSVGPLTSVQFTTPTLGWGLAGGSPIISPSGAPLPLAGGTLVVTTDGGQTWISHPGASPVQSICLEDPALGWAAHGPRVQRTTDGGVTWSTSFTAPLDTRIAWSATVRCAATGVAWVMFVGSDAAMGHVPYVLYRTLDGETWAPIFSGRYLSGWYPSVEAPDGPGSRPGPFSVLDSRSAFVLGAAPAPWTTIAVTGDGGTTWRSERIPDQPADEPFALAFVDADRGWVAGARDGHMVLLATMDGGRTWSSQL